MILTQKTSDQNTKFHKNTPAVFMPSSKEIARTDRQTGFFEDLYFDNFASNVRI